MVGEARGARGRAAPAAACRRMGCRRVDGADDGWGRRKGLSCGFSAKKKEGLSGDTLTLLVDFSYLYPYH